MTAPAIRLAQGGEMSLRTAGALLVIATLPLTYALTLPVGFPLKIYELVLGGLLLALLVEGRMLIAPGLRVYVEALLAFLALCAVVLAFRLVFRLDTFTDSGFASRAGPVGDGVLKFAYWGLAVLAFVIVATQTYESPARVGRLWCRAAAAASVYAWLLVIPSALNLPAPLLPGMDAAARITLGGREILRGGTFQEGNFFALYLLVSIAIAVWMRRYRTAGFFAATVFITFSTANVAGLGAMVAWAALVRMRQTRDIRVQTRVFLTAMLLAAIALGGLVASGYLQTIFVAKLTGEQFASGLDRLDLTVAGVRMIAAHPLTGVGLSQYGYNYRPFQLTDVFDVSRPVKPIATNSWVELAAETGVLGTALILAFSVCLWRATRGDGRIALRCGLIAVGLGLFTFPAPTVIFLWAYFGFIVGVALRDRVPSAMRGLIPVAGTARDR